MKRSSEKDQPSVWFDLRPAVHVGFADVDCYHQFQPNGLHVRWKHTLLPWQTQTSFHMIWKWIEWRTAKMRKRKGEGERERERERNEWFSEEHIKTESNIDGLRTAGFGLARCLWKCELPPVKTKYITKRKRCLPHLRTHCSGPGTLPDFLAPIRLSKDHIISQEVHLKKEW